MSSIGWRGWAAVIGGLGVLVAVVLAALAVAGRSGSHDRRVSQGAPMAWRVVPSSALGHLEGSAIAAGPGGTAWTVGQAPWSTACGKDYIRPQIAGYIDGRWQQVPTPRTSSAPARCDGLNDVVVVGRSTAWAVGSPDPLQKQHLSLIEYWDGAGWRITHSPSLAGHLVRLQGVAAVPGTRDIWAVGRGNGRPVAIQHAHGHWRAYQLPMNGPSIRGSSGSLWAIASGGVDATWAFGNSYGITPSRGGLLIDRWQHGRWWNAHRPPGMQTAFIYGADASPDGDVWAVGTLDYDQKFLMLHWQRDTGWRVFTFPCHGPSGWGCRASDVAAVSAKEAWAVGWDGPRAVLYHWIDPHWIRTRPPATPGTDPTLYSVARIPGQPGQLWAIGSSITNRTTSSRTALVLRRG